MQCADSEPLHQLHGHDNVSAADCAARLPARLSDQAVNARSHATVYTIKMIKCPPNEIRYSYRFQHQKTVFALVLPCSYRASCIPLPSPAKNLGRHTIFWNGKKLRAITMPTLPIAQPFALLIDQGSSSLLRSTDYSFFSVCTLVFLSEVKSTSNCSKIYFVTSKSRGYVYVPLQAKSRSTYFILFTLTFTLLLCYLTVLSDRLGPT